MHGGVGGGQQAVQLQFEHSMDSKLNWNYQSLLSWIVTLLVLNTSM